MLKWTSLIELDNSGVNRISEVPGIYRLSYLDSYNNYIVYYAGQAKNLKERLGQHLLLAETNLGCIKKLKQYRCFLKQQEFLFNQRETQLKLHYIINLHPNV